MFKFKPHSLFSFIVITVFICNLMGCGFKLNEPSGGGSTKDEDGGSTKDEVGDMMTDKELFDAMEQIIVNENAVEVVALMVSCDFGDENCWEVYNPGEEVLNDEGFDAVGFHGAVSGPSGEIYLVPNHFNDDGGDKVFHTHVVRFDPSRGFSDQSAWKIHNAQQDDSNRGYAGAVRAGRYIYFAPNKYDNRLRNQMFLRYDTAGRFKDPASWTSYENITVYENNGSEIIAANFTGAIIKDNFIYFIPGHRAGVGDDYAAQGGLMNKTVFMRYAIPENPDDFTDPDQWTAFNVGRVGLVGCVDGDGNVLGEDLRHSLCERTRHHNYSIRTQSHGTVLGPYIYFAANDSNSLLRYDTRLEFAANGSWDFFNASSVTENVGFFSAASDGRYIYYRHGAAASLLRFDTQGGIDVNGSVFANEDNWIVIDPSVFGEVGSLPAVIRVIEDYLYIPAGSRSNEMARFNTTMDPDEEEAWEYFTAPQAGFSDVIFSPVSRSVIFVPWVDHNGAHGNVLRYRIDVEE